MTRYVLIHGVLSYGRRREEGLNLEELQGTGQGRKRTPRDSLLPLKGEAAALKRRRPRYFKGKTFCRDLKARKRRKERGSSALDREANCYRDRASGRYGRGSTNWKQKTELFETHRGMPEIATLLAEKVIQEKGEGVN